jgi:hypothetical protein
VPALKAHTRPEATGRYGPDLLRSRSWFLGLYRRIVRTEHQAGKERLCAQSLDCQPGVRIARACRDSDLGSVAVYADPDRDGVHVRMADEAVPLGGATPADSYLDVGRVLPVAIKAAFGGGGSGVTVARSVEEIPSCYAAAVRGAAAAFGQAPASIWSGRCSAWRKARYLATETRPFRGTPSSSGSTLRTLITASRRLRAW